MTQNTLSVDALPSISLTELEGVAPLLTRKDRKYLVPMSVARLLVSQTGLRVLEIDGRRTFRYESVYFDTPDRISYLAAAHKRRRRFKVRTRSYLDSGLCSLEVKTRERRGLTEKHRLPYTVAQRGELDSAALQFIDGFDAIAPHSGRLEPALTTRYERTTLLEISSMSRITIDTSLQCETPAGSSVSQSKMAVIETKTAGPPSATDHFLWSLHERPVQISKYCTGLAALTPGLPANKWNRVLRQHFDWTPAPVPLYSGVPGPKPAEAADIAPLDRRSIGRDRAPWVPFLEGAGS